MKYDLKKLFALSALALCMQSPMTVWADDDDEDEKEITFIHTSDLHGDFHSHDNVRDGQPVEGGLARVYTKIREIRKDNDNTFYVHTGDTIQGSAQTLFTRGQAMVDVLNRFNIQSFAPGNWEFTYGLARFRELFLGANGNSPLASWGISAVNVYYNGSPGNSDPNGAFYDPMAPYAAEWAGNRFVEPNGKPYRVVMVGNVKLGIFGCTTNRGPQIVGQNVTEGVTFTNCKGEVQAANNKPILWQGTGHANQDPADPTNGYKVKAEIPHFVNILRNVEKVDMVILMSEGGLAENIYNAQTNDGIDIIFSSDMHEETNYPVVVTTPNGGKTIVIEEGEDGAQVGELEVELKNGKIKEWKWREHDITAKVEENARIHDLIETVNAPFEGATFVPGVYTNPYNGTKLNIPLDTVIGKTQIELSRNRYSYEHPTTTGNMPGVIEGTGHALITDAFRHVTNALLPANEKMSADGVPAADGKYLVGAIRGFRYVNSYPAGSDITYEDLFHFLSIGPQVAVTELTAAALNNQTESAADSCMNPDVTKWAGGWMFNFSGVTMDMYPYDVIARTDATNPATGTAWTLNDGRIFNFKLGRTNINDATPGQTLAANGVRYRYASYYYDVNPTQVNNINPAPNATIRKIMRRKGTATGDVAGLALVQVRPTAAADIADYENVDAAEVVAVYIKHFLNGEITAAKLPFPRINLVDKAGAPSYLPDTRPLLGFPTVEPVFGARLSPSIYDTVNYQPWQYDQN